MSRKKTLPQPITVTIESLSHDGRGIAHVNQKTVFVSNALPGESVVAEYQKTHSRFDETQAIEIREPSADRITPSCDYHLMCGGCQLQHINPEAQINLKQAAVLNQLQHIGKTSAASILPPITSPTSGYRSKGRLSVKYRDKTHEVLVGFREKNGRYVTRMESCQIAHPKVGRHISDFKQLIKSLSIPDAIPQIEFAMGDNQHALIFRHLAPLSNADLQALTQFGASFGFSIFLQPNKPHNIYKLYPEDENMLLSYSHHNSATQYFFHATDFTQVNVAVNQKMIDQVIELLQPNQDDHILDLFCGLGNFSLPVAKQAKFVTGVEGDQAMVQRASMNAAHNHIDNVAFFAANLSENCQHASWFKPQYAKLLLDPPRCGALEILQQLQTLKIPRIVYVSCDPATLARDTEYLTQTLRYQLKKVGIMDMFPHTKHVETIALFELKT